MTFIAFNEATEPFEEFLTVVKQNDLYLIMAERTRTVNQIDVAPAHQYFSLIYQYEIAAKEQAEAIPHFFNSGVENFIEAIYRMTRLLIAAMRRDGSSAVSAIESLARAYNTFAFRLANAINKDHLSEADQQRLLDPNIVLDQKVEDQCVGDFKKPDRAAWKKCVIADYPFLKFPDNHSVLSEKDLAEMIVGSIGMLVNGGADPGNLNVKYSKGFTIMIHQDQNQRGNQGQSLVAKIADRFLKLNESERRFFTRASKLVDIKIASTFEPVLSRGLYEEAQRGLPTEEVRIPTTIMGMQRVNPSAGVGSAPNATPIKGNQRQESTISSLDSSASYTSSYVADFLSERLKEPGHKAGSGSGSGETQALPVGDAVESHGTPAGVVSGEESSVGKSGSFPAPAKATDTAPLRTASEAVSQTETPSLRENAPLLGEKEPALWQRLLCCCYRPRQNHHHL